MKKRDTSLVTLMRDDPKLSERIKKIAEEVKKDSSKIKTMADTYNQRYKKEIEDGTARKLLLLEDGKRKGKTESEIELGSGFIPSVYTPILNWLFFFITEGENVKKKYQREELDDTYRMLLHEEKEAGESIETAPELETYIYGNMTMESFQTLKKLKRLSRSPNEHEAFQAYRKCHELCKRYSVEFDKIPE